LGPVGDFVFVRLAHYNSIGWVTELASSPQDTWASYSRRFCCMEQMDHWGEPGWRGTRLLLRQKVTGNISGNYIVRCDFHVSCGYYACLCAGKLQNVTVGWVGVKYFWCVHTG